MISGKIDNSPVRKLKAKVELYEGSTLVETYSYNNVLTSIDIDRLGEESKFFGFGVSQKATIKIRDLAQRNITTANSLKIYFASGEEEYINNFPTFYVTETKKDEKTNELTITAYDVIYKASNDDTTAVLEEISKLYNGVDLLTLGSLLCYLLGCDGPTFVGLSQPTYLDLTFTEQQLNLEGTEKIRDVLNYMAEIMQCIYYVNNENQLVFKQLSKSGNPVLTVTKSDYMDLESKPSCKLTTIIKTTQLGDSLTVTTGEEGVTQYIRDNQLLELRDDVAVNVLNSALTKVGGLTINQFNCTWRGNYLLEIGDKIALVTKNDDVIHSYVINDVISYNGGLREKTSWSYEDNDGETANNPASLGEAIKQTYAKVDKVNKQIDIVASESNANSSAIAALQVNTDSISATVNKMAEETRTNLETNTEEINKLKQSVSAQMTPEAIKVLVQSELDNGVTKVETTTGVTVDDRGLTIDKSSSDLNTTVSENGMSIYKKNEENDPMLRANDEGVKAKNLHATTYLIIGKNSRFEDYGTGRTGCFWIGGSR